MAQHLSWPATPRNHNSKRLIGRKASGTSGFLGTRSRLSTSRSTQMPPLGTGPDDLPQRVYRLLDGLGDELRVAGLEFERLTLLEALRVPRPGVGEECVQDLLADIRDLRVELAGDASTELVPAKIRLVFLAVACYASALLR